MQISLNLNTEANINFVKFVYKPVQYYCLILSPQEMKPQQRFCSDEVLLEKIVQVEVTLSITRLGLT